MGLSPRTIEQIELLATEMAAMFSPPEMIVGCEVLSVADKDQYASDNGWIEARVGRHNQQRCRWRGQFANVQVGDYVDVLFFASYRLFVVFGQGGAGAISPPSAWPFSKVLTVSTINPAANYPTIAAALADVEDGQVILLDAEDYTVTNLSTDKNIKILGPGSEVCRIISSSAGFVLTWLDGDTKFEIEGLSLIHQGTSSGGCFDVQLNATAIDDNVPIRIRNCVFLSEATGVATTNTAIKTTEVSLDNTAYMYIYDSQIWARFGGGENVGIDIYDAGTHFWINSGSDVFGFTWSGRMNAGVNAQGFFQSNISNTSFSIANGSLLRGRYYDNSTSHNIITLDKTGETAGVWLVDESATLRIKQADIPAAITAAAASGDLIEIDADTYTAPNVAGGVAVSKSLAIVGKSPEQTIITRADDSSTVMTVSGTPVRLKGLTIQHTGGTGAGGCTNLATDQAGLVLDKVYLIHTVGADGNHVGLLQTAGDSLLRNCKINVSGGTLLNYAVYLGTAGSTCIIEGGEVLAGTIATAHASAVIELRGPRLASGVTLDVSGGGVIRGYYYDSNGHFRVVGASDILGVGSNFPDLGSTTAAEKIGNIYLTLNKDIFPDNDIFGLWSRLINYGFNPTEHWHQNADELAWAGWAAYTGFVTPSLISIANSLYIAGYASGAAKWFRYRAAATGADITLRTRVTVSYLASGGVMIDDGVDAGDGNGANNFYRCYVDNSALGGVFNIKESYRTGGGGVTTNTMTPVVPPAQFIGLCLATVGTRWSNWGCYLILLGESGSQIVSITAGGFTWTPAWVGLFGAGTAADAGRQSIWDWYTEG